jgi:hypothetical protein
LIGTEFLSLLRNKGKQIILAFLYKGLSTRPAPLPGSSLAQAIAMLTMCLPHSKSELMLSMNEESNRLRGESLERRSFYLRKHYFTFKRTITLVGSSEEKRSMRERSLTNS